MSKRFVLALMPVLVIAVAVAAAAATPELPKIVVLATAEPSPAPSPRRGPRLQVRQSVDRVVDCRRARLDKLARITGEQIASIAART